MSRTFQEYKEEVVSIEKGMHFIDTMHLDFNYILLELSSIFRSPKPSVPLKAFPNINYHVVVVSVLESLSRAHLLLLSSSLERRKTSRRRNRQAQSSNHNAVCSHSIYPRS